MNANTDADPETSAEIVLALHRAFGGTIEVSRKGVPIALCLPTGERIGSGKGHGLGGPRTFGVNRCPAPHANWHGGYIVALRRFATWRDALRAVQDITGCVSRGMT